VNPRFELHARERATTARCLYCHDDVAGDVWRCAACDTAYHAACVAELGGGCALLGCGGRAKATEARRRGSLWVSLGVAVAIVFVAIPALLVAILAVALRLSPPDDERGSKQVITPEITARIR